MRKKGDISPDEIFIESSNISQFNTSQFEGRLEKPISKKTFTGISILLVIIFTIFSGRLWYLQVQKGEAYSEISENNRLNHVPVFAERGVIFDRNGERLSWNVPNQENDDFSLRQYTDTAGLAHILGYVSHPAKDSSGFYYQYYFEGKDGAERVFDESLKGTNGIKISETDAHGGILSESVIENPEPGENIYLSIDSRVQNKLYTTMRDLAQEVGFSGGAGVIMDVETGELIALTSYPEYDMQAFSLGDDAELIGKTLNNEKMPLLNRATLGIYTPGSIVKPFMAIAALNEEVINPQKEILSTGRMIVPNPYNPDEPSVFNDWKAHGYVDMYKALAVSSNVYFYQIGGGFEGQQGIGIVNINKYMRMFGFGEKTGIELKSEEYGVIPSPEWKEENFEDGTWRVGDTYNTSIGQYGFQVTPIQVVRAVAAVANNGVVFNPTILKSDGSTSNIDHVVDIPRNYFEEVRKGMRQAVEEGTAQGISVPYIRLAGKTGTAEVGTQKKRVNAWITGFFPYENPRYAFTVVMEQGPSDNLLGGVFVMRTMLDWMRDNTPEYLDL